MGAIEVILSVMKTHANNTSVCEYGCGTLWNITFNGTRHKHNTHEKQNNQEITADNKVKAGEVGAIEAILYVMKTHSTDAVICEKGCRILNNITFNGTCHKHNTHEKQK